MGVAMLSLTVVVVIFLVEQGKFQRQYWMHTEQGRKRMKKEMDELTEKLKTYPLP
jgi:hypothetical protein